MDTWRNGCFGKMDDLPDNTTPTHNPPKMDILPKSCLQIILAAKWLVWHSSNSDDLCLLFCINPSSMYVISKQHNRVRKRLYFFRYVHVHCYVVVNFIMGY